MPALGNSKREIVMSDLLVRNLDEATVAQVENRARGNGRSLLAELKLILEQAARPESPRPSRGEYRVLADRIRATLGDRPQTDSAAMLAEDRTR
jgi:plasmid stability protein